MKTHIPPDIISNQVAKRCQDMLSDVIYRTYLHQWTCHPDQEDAIRARKTNEILSDVGSSSMCIHKERRFRRFLEYLKTANLAVNVRRCSTRTI